MTNRELFKEAIAEAKSIREAAIINAKEALEESLTPQIKSLLAQRLAEMEEEEMSVDETEELQSSFVAENDDEEAEEAEEGEEEGAAEKAEDESEDEDIDVGEMSVDDLRDLIRDIVGQMVDQDGDSDHDMDDPAMEEPAGDEAPETALMSADEEEIDLDEILRELGDSYQEVDKTQTSTTTSITETYKSNELTRVKKDLQEAVTTINTLRAELQDVNLLNAKLLYINKLFKTAKTLSESQKANIITTFDKATTVKEAQLVFESLKQAVNTKQAAPIRESKLGIASAPAAARTAKKPEIIAEVSDAVKRMQKLAGIIK